MTLEGGFLNVVGVGKTESGTDSGLENIVGTGSKFHLSVRRFPIFRNFSSKCLAQIPLCRGGVQFFLLTNLIHFLFNSLFFTGK